MSEAAEISVSQFLNEDGSIKIWPKKRSRQIPLLEILSTYFENDVQYDEQQVNAIIASHHSFGDHSLLRRELITAGFLSRTPEGKRYWRSKGGQNDDVRQGRTEQ